MNPSPMAAHISATSNQCDLLRLRQQQLSIRLSLEKEKSEICY